MAHTLETQIPVDDLPLWMRQAQRGVDWGVLLVLLTCLLLTVPRLLADDGLPQMGALENYLLLAADYAEALREGRLYPRWSAHVLGGYGAPIPHYTPPGTSYTLALLSLFITGDLIDAARVALVAAVCLAGCGMYVFVLRWGGAHHATLSAILYVTSPHLALDLPYLLGDLPLMWGLALLPLALWAVSRLIAVNRYQDFALASLLLSALVLTEPRLALVGIALSLILLEWRRASGHAAVTRRTLISVLGLGLWLAAFYWMPALLEYRLVQWLEPAIPRAPLVLSLPALLTPYAPLDPADLRPAPQFTLGLPLALAVCATLIYLLVAGWRRRGQPLDFAALMLIAGAGALVALLSFAPDQAWLFGLAVFLLAAGGGCAQRWFYALPPRPRDNALIVVLIGVLMVSLPLLAMPGTPALQSDDLTPIAQLRYEQQGFGVPVVPPHAHTPSALPSETPTSRWLISSYVSGTPNRVAPEQLGGSAQVVILSQGTHSAQLQVTSQGGQAIPYLMTYFPGWHATMDGRRLSVRPDPQTGLTLIDIPPTRSGVIDLRLEATPARQLAWVVSLAALAVCLLVTRLRYLRQPRTPFYDDLRLLPPSTARLLAVLLGAFTLVIGVSTQADDLYLIHGRPFYQVEPAQAFRAQTEVGLEMIAYRLASSRARPGDTLTVSLFWRTLRPVANNYRVVVALEDTARRELVYTSPHRHPGDHPTRRWTTDGYVRDVHHLPLPPDLRPGSYQITVELHLCATPACATTERLTFFEPTRRQTLVRIPAAITILPAG